MYVMFVDPFWEEIRLFEQRFGHQQYAEGSGLPPNAAVINDPPNVELWLAQLVLDGVVRINNKGTYSCNYHRPYNERHFGGATQYLDSFVEKCNNASYKVDNVLSQLPYCHYQIDPGHSFLQMYQYSQDTLRCLINANEEYYDCLADFEIALEREPNRMRSLFGVDRKADNFLANGSSYTRTFETNEGHLELSINDFGSVQRINWPEYFDRCSNAQCRSGKLRHLSIVINNLVDQIDLLVSSFVVSLADHRNFLTELMTIPLDQRYRQEVRPDNRLHVEQVSIDISLSFTTNTPE